LHIKTVDSFIDEARALLQGRITKSKAEALAAQLKKVGMIDMGNSSDEARGVWRQISPKWSAYLEKHPEISLEVPLSLLFWVSTFFSFVIVVLYEY